MFRVNEHRPAWSGLWLQGKWVSRSLRVNKFKFLLHALTAQLQNIILNLLDQLSKNKQLSFSEMWSVHCMVYLHHHGQQVAMARSGICRGHSTQQSLGRSNCYPTLWNGFMPPALEKAFSSHVATQSGPFPPFRQRKSEFFTSTANL